VLETVCAEITTGCQSCWSPERLISGADAQKEEFRLLELV